eukprot:TRINITY_DN15065_c1_g1_i1.p4 TRINITY_DN15065_c1_g1~~TRINITY_DN15065_c1_g1_i1.p4  ORF type:complete len:113 (+),score=20.05 TRINITY_DN15065_c1_g1_i1:130-468(+)
MILSLQNQANFGNRVVQQKVLLKPQNQKLVKFGTAVCQRQRNANIVRSVDDQFVYSVAQAVETTGNVEAPIWIVVASAAVVTIGSLLAVFLLKPGIDAQEKMQERDSRKWNK